MTSPAANILNLSWGTQSWTLAAMSALGQILPDGRTLPHIDLAIFCDTGYERKGTLDFMATTRPWLEQHGIPVRVVRPKNNSLTLPNAAGSPIPAFVQWPAGARRTMLTRRCTHHWKILVVRRAIRDFMRAKHIPLKPGVISQWFGITIDEVARVRRSNRMHIVHRYPLIELRMTRDDCIEWLKHQKLPVPGKSSCVFCPYQSLASWRDLANRPDDYTAAAEADNLIRNAYNRAPLFIHPSTRPLAEAIQTTTTPPDQSPEDLCDTGYCWT